MGYNPSTTGRFKRSPGLGEQHWGKDSHSSDTEYWGSHALLLSLHSFFPIGHLDKLSFLNLLTTHALVLLFSGAPVSAASSCFSSFGWAAISWPSLTHPNKLQELKTLLSSPWALCRAHRGFTPGLWVPVIPSGLGAALRGQCRRRRQCSTNHRLAAEVQWKSYSPETLIAAGKPRGDMKQQHMLLKSLQEWKETERTGRLRIEPRMLLGFVCLFAHLHFLLVK